MQTLDRFTPLLDDLAALPLTWRTRFDGPIESTTDCKCTGFCLISSGSGTLDTALMSKYHLSRDDAWLWIASNDNRPYSLIPSRRIKPDLTLRSAILTACKLPTDSHIIPT